MKYGTNKYNHELTKWTVIFSKYLFKIKEIKLELR